ncbi:MAG TPA: hypothetical protein DCE42_22695 [Myxococcales bacterium]|nr:hypothetical protein [Myxococcales bacterium]
MRKKKIILCQNIDLHFSSNHKHLKPNEELQVKKKGFFRQEHSTQLKKKVTYLAVPQYKKETTLHKYASKTHQELRKDAYI